jgi:hypothetical protein
LKQLNLGYLVGSSGQEQKAKRSCSEQSHKDDEQPLVKDGVDPGSRRVRLVLLHYAMSLYMANSQLQCPDNLIGLCLPCFCSRAK